MSRAEAWFEQKYKKGAIHKVQSQGYLLRDAVTKGTTTNGSKVTWKLVGTGEATERQKGAGKVPRMNVDRLSLTADFKDYEANDEIDTLDVNKMSEDEQQIAQESAAMAIGRKFDKLIIGELDAASTDITTIGDGTAALTLLNVFSGVASIAGISGKGHDFYCALRAWDLTQLELYTQMSSEDFAGPEHMLMREIGARRYRGITFIPVPDDHFAVPNTNQIDMYLWAKQAVGFEWNKQLQSRIDYLPDYKKWLASNDISCATKVLMPETIRRFRMKSNAALVIPA